jgi:alkanesulfonate monooxygenase SsuD/methylene tetrahydromethanopterin reductase-like flavin-dependent oxidoreductase (luciferase family)
MTTSAIGKAATKATTIVEVNALSKFTSWRTVTVDYCARRNWIVGSPATVTEKIETIYHEVGGFGTLLVHPSLGTAIRDARRKWFDHRTLGKVVGRAVAIRMQIEDSCHNTKMCRRP